MTHDPAQIDTQEPNWKAIISLSFVVFALITSEYLPVSLLTPIARELGVSEGTAGQMISATSVAAVVTSLLIAPLTRGVDRRTVLLGGTLALVLSNVLVALAPNLVVIMLARVLLGVAIGGFWSLSNATALRLTPRLLLPKALAMISGGAALANTFAPPMGSLLGEVLGWRGVFGVAALLSLAGLAWQWFSLPGMAAGHPAQLRTLLRLLQRPQVRNGFVAVLLTFGGYMFFYAYLRPFLEQVTHLNISQISGVLLALGVAGVVGTALSSRLLTWNLRRTHILVPLLMAVLTFALLLVGAFPLWTAVVLVLLGLVTSGLSVAWGNWLALAVPDEPESAGGLQIAAIHLGLTLGAALGGLVIDRIGTGGLLIGSAAALLLGAFVIWRGLNHRFTLPAHH